MYFVMHEVYKPRFGENGLIVSDPEIPNNFCYCYNEGRAASNVNFYFCREEALKFLFECIRRHDYHCDFSSDEHYNEEKSRYGKFFHINEENQNWEIGKLSPDEIEEYYNLLREQNMAYNMPFCFGKVK